MPSKRKKKAPTVAPSEETPATPTTPTTPATPTSPPALVSNTPTSNSFNDLVSLDQQPLSSPISTPSPSPTSSIDGTSTEEHPLMIAVTTGVHDEKVIDASLIAEYRCWDVANIINDIDIDPETKSSLVYAFWKLGWIPDTELSHVILIAACNNEWELARTIVGFKPGMKHWGTLRKLIGNWDRFRDRRQLKELCMFVMKADPTAMPSLNKWAVEYAKRLDGRVIKGYCDLCLGDSKTFAMMHSDF